MKVGEISPLYEIHYFLFIHIKFKIWFYRNLHSSTTYTLNSTYFSDIKIAPDILKEKKKLAQFSLIRDQKRP